MAAASVTGIGNGVSNKPTVKDLSNAANGPTILIADDTATVTLVALSPSGYGGTVMFNQPLALNSSNYIVLLTGVSSENCYMTTFVDVDQKCAGFDFFTSENDTLMYMVVKKGVRSEEES